LKIGQRFRLQRPAVALGAIGRVAPFHIDDRRRLVLLALAPGRHLRLPEIDFARLAKAAHDEIGVSPVRVRKYATQHIDLLPRIRRDRVQRFDFIVARRHFSECANDVPSFSDFPQQLYTLKLNDGANTRRMVVAALLLEILRLFCYAFCRLADGKKDQKTWFWRQRD